MDHWNDYWRDLVHKRDVVNDPHRWRYYDDTSDGLTHEDWICIHPDLMFNFWACGCWLGGVPYRCPICSADFWEVLNTYARSDGTQVALCSESCLYKYDLVTSDL